jgi:hypothetical protein
MYVVYLSIKDSIIFLYFFKIKYEVPPSAICK